jgi:hypothetical protein
MEDISTNPKCSSSMSTYVLSISFISTTFQQTSGSEQFTQRCNRCDSVVVRTLQIFDLEVKLSFSPHTQCHPWSNAQLDKGPCNCRCDAWLLEALLTGSLCTCSLWPICVAANVTCSIRSNVTQWHWTQADSFLSSVHFCQQVHCLDEHIFWLEWLPLITSVTWLDPSYSLNGTGMS